MKQEFYDRKDELSLLNRKYDALENGELLAIYGRRRVGKTELVKQFMGGVKDKMYFYVDLSGRQELLNSLSNTISVQLGETLIFNNASGFFDYIVEKSKKTKFLLVIDEFQRFLDVAPEFITQLQHYWDSELKHRKIMIILVGSSIGMIQRITESKAGALYGRATKIKISPFRYVDFRLMFKDLDEEEKIIRYAVFGGTPYYLEKAKKLSNTLDAINELLLKKGGELAEEPKTLLEYENLRTHAKYNSILHAVSSGKEMLREIQDFTHLPVTVMPSYITKLDILLDLLGKRDPVLGKERLGRYTIKDNFFRFWYKFIFPNQTALSLGNTKLVLDIIKENLNSYVGRIFEDVCREAMILAQNKRIKNVDINFEAIGSWWDKSGNEIDIIAYNRKEKTILVGEVKWSNKPVDRAVLSDLIRKSRLLNFGGSYKYLIISKSGFTEQCIADMKHINCLYFDLTGLSKLFEEV